MSTAWHGPPYLDNSFEMHLDDAYRGGQQPPASHDIYVPLLQSTTLLSRNASHSRSPPVWQHANVGRDGSEHVKVAGSGKVAHTPTGYPADVTYTCS